MLFVYQHYPQYSGNPLDILDWLHNFATGQEEQERILNQQNQEAYGMPRN